MPNAYYYMISRRQVLSKQEKNQEFNARWPEGCNVCGGLCRRDLSSVPGGQVNNPWAHWLISHAITHTCMPNVFFLLPVPIYLHKDMLVHCTNQSFLSLGVAGLELPSVDSAPCLLAFGLCSPVSVGSRMLLLLAPNSEPPPTNRHRQGST
jgi:hypothetical protein